MLFDIIQEICLDCNTIEQSNKVQIILSDILDTICKTGSVHIPAINLAIIELVSKVLLSDNIKGISITILKAY